VLNRPNTSSDPSERLRLKIAEALRGTTWIVETSAEGGQGSCGVCGLMLADSLLLGKGHRKVIYSTRDRQTWICSTCFWEFRKVAGWKTESPHMRELRLPITTDQLYPLDPRCRIVQFAIMTGPPLTEADFQLVAGFLRQYPDIPFRVYGGNPALKDLDFLRHFPFVKKFQVDVWDLESLDGLRFLPDDLERLAVGSTKSKRQSLRFLQRFPALKQLFLESHSKDFDAVGSLMQLETLGLRSITLPDLSVLTRLGRLKSLAIKLGGTKDLSLLHQIGKLRYLELWMIRGLADLSSLGGLECLQYLVLETLKHVQALPSFRKLRLLRRVRLLNMKGLRDLSGISEAPALEDLVVFEMRHLTADAFRPFVGHPALRTVSVGLGSRSKDAAVHALLRLPTVEGRFQFTPEEGGDCASPSPLGA